MAASSETKILIPEEDIAESCEIVNRWLERNENFIGHPPAEHYIMSELNETRFSRSRQCKQVVPLYLPIRSIKLASMTISPMVPACTTPLRKTYAEMAVEYKSQTEPYAPNFTGYFQQPELSHSEIQMPVQVLTQHTQINEPVKETETNSKPSKDSIVYIL